VVLDEAYRLVGFPVGEVLALFARLERWDTALASVGVRVEVARRLAEIAPADIEIKTLPVRIPIVRSKVPLADMARDVPSGF